MSLHHAGQHERGQCQTGEEMSRHCGIFLSLEHTYCTAPAASEPAWPLSVPWQHLEIDGEWLYAPGRGWFSSLCSSRFQNVSYAIKEYEKKYKETSICQSLGGEKAGQRVCVQEVCSGDGYSVLSAYWIIYLKIIWQVNFMLYISYCNKKW